MGPKWIDQLKTYLLITVGSLLYAAGTVFFIFPNGLLLGGTSGISVILEAFLPFSPGTILMVINFFLLILAFVIFGREMAVKNVVGSVLTTGFVGLLEALAKLNGPVIPNHLLSGCVGAAIIAVASGCMFYVDASSGGTDIVALIVRKYAHMDIGKALLATDVLIVVVGGILSGWVIGLCSFVGLLIKTLGIDFVISVIRKFTAKRG